MNQVLFKSIIAAGVLAITAATFADYHPDRIVAKRSAHTVTATVDKLTAIVREHGLTVFARIDHAAGAAKVGQTLRPTQTLIFGNPNAGAKLIDAHQSASLDLPIRVAVWEDSEGSVWLAYDDPTWITARHGIETRRSVVVTMAATLDKLTNAATSVNQRASKNNRAGRSWIRNR